MVVRARSKGSDLPGRQKKSATGVCARASALRATVAVMASSRLAVFIGWCG